MEVGERSGGLKEEELDSLIRHDAGNKVQIAQGYLELIRGKDILDEGKSHLERASGSVKKLQGYIENLGKGDDRFDKAERRIQTVQNHLGGLKDVELTQEQKKYVEKAVEAVKDGADLMENVKTLKKIRRGDVAERPVELNPVIEDAAGQYSSIDIKFRPGDEYYIQGGPLLKRPFDNIIGNAAQHSQGSQMGIYTEDKNDEVLVILEDNGRGIPGGEKDEIFEKGCKGSESSGSGLGLYLSKRILEGYGGDIKVRDSKELGGARFDVSLLKA